MAMQYTPAQRTAVFYPDGDLLLSAAAGSGKTAALTGRIVELIREGRAELSDMLIVTFTRAAAAEMRSRISSKLQALMEESRGTDPGLSARLSRSLSQIASADISTIHSFLSKSLRPYFPLLGLPSDARIAETRITDAMKKQIMRETADDFFRMPAKQNDGSSNEQFNGSDVPAKASFPELADIIGQARDTDRIDEELLWLAEKLLLAGQDENDLLRFADGLETEASSEFLFTAAGSVIRKELQAFCDHYLAVFREFREEFAAEPVTEEKYGPNAEYLIGWLESLDALLNARNTDYDALRSFFLSYAPPTLGRLLKKDATETSELFKSFRDELKADVTKRLRDRFFAGTSEEARMTARQTAKLLRCAADVIGEFLRRFSKAKAERAILDYGDLETFALRLLLDEDGSPTKTAEEIGARYRYVFIDEYQDTNGVQDRIFRAVCGNNGERCVRFMVGDVKQSIYRFRGADPSVFSGCRLAWENLTPAPEGESPELSRDADSGSVRGRSLFMSENFRCAKPIVDFTNCVSEYLLPHGGTPFGREDRLIHARGEAFNPPPAEICLIRKDPGPSDDESEEARAHQAQQAQTGDAPEEAADPEAAYVARRIARMIGRYTEEGTVRRASDIAILLRSPSSTGETYREELAKLGVPAVLKKEKPLGTFPSVMLLMCLLNFVDNPLRDIYAAGALRSPVFGFTLADLIELKRVCCGRSLLEGLEEAAEAEKITDEPDETDETEQPESPDAPEQPELPDAPEKPELPDAPDPSEEPASPSNEKQTAAALREKCVRALEWLRRHKTVAGGLSAEKYLEFLIRDTDLYGIPGIRGVSAERTAVQKFTRLAQTYERSSRASSAFGGLSGFLDYAAEDLQSTESEEEGGTSDGGDCVSILSIHASKGLEYPVCFVSDCAKKRNAADETRTVLFDPALGLGMSLPDESGLAKCETLQKAAVSEKIRRDSIDEEMRMFYVALTRAQTHLILTAKVKDPEEAMEKAEIQAEFSDRFRVSRCPDYITWVLEALAKNPIPGSVKRITVEPGPGGEFTESVVSSSGAADGSAAESSAEAEGSAETAASAETEAPLPGDFAETTDGEKEKTPAVPTKDEWAARFAFRYPDSYRNSIPAKLTVSRLYPQILDEPEEEGFPSIDAAAAEKKTEKTTVRPAFLLEAEGRQAEASPTDRGSAAHVFLQFTDHRRLREEGVSAELERLVKERFLSPAQAALIPASQLERFRVSPLMDALLRSDFVRREFRFNVRMPAADFTGDDELREKLLENGDKITVQGVVDCVYRDPDTGRLALIDYKTDTFTAEEFRDRRLAEAKLRERHRRQLTYYRGICERLFGEEIASAAVYSTVLGVLVEV